MVTATETDVFALHQSGIVFVLGSLPANPSPGQSLHFQRRAVSVPSLRCSSECSIWPIRSVASVNSIKASRRGLAVSCRDVFPDPDIAFAPMAKLLQYKYPLAESADHLLFRRQRCEEEAQLKVRRELGDEDADEEMAEYRVAQIEALTDELMSKAVISGTCQSTEVSVKFCIEAQMARHVKLSNLITLLAFSASPIRADGLHAYCLLWTLVNIARALTSVSRQSASVLRILSIADSTRASCGAFLATLSAALDASLLQEESLPHEHVSVTIEDSMLISTDRRLSQRFLSAGNQQQLTEMLRKAKEAFAHRAALPDTVRPEYRLYGLPDLELGPFSAKEEKEDKAPLSDEMATKHLTQVSSPKEKKRRAARKVPMTADQDMKPDKKSFTDKQADAPLGEKSGGDGWEVIRSRKKVSKGTTLACSVPTNQPWRPLDFPVISPERAPSPVVRASRAPVGVALRPLGTVVSPSIKLSRGGWIRPDATPQPADFRSIEQEELEVQAALHAVARFEADERAEAEALKRALKKSLKQTKQKRSLQQI